MTPEYYAFIGIAATSAFFFVAFFAWDCMKNHVAAHVYEEMSELRKEIFRELDERERSTHETMEYNSRSDEERFSEIERSINNQVSMISE